MIILFGNKKGGCTKSITLVNTAGVAVNAGYKVCIVDADTNETLNRYIRRREATSEKRTNDGLEPLPYIKVEIRRPEDSLIRDLRELDNLYDYVFVDTGGYENKAFVSSVGAADVVYMPFQASQADIEQVIPTLKVLSDTENSMHMIDNLDFEIDCRLLVSNVDHHSKDMLGQAREACKSLLHQASISSCVIAHTKEVRKIQDSGVTLSDKVFTGGRAHPKRAMYEMLFDEIRGTRKVMHKRNQPVSEESESLKTA